MNSSATLRPSTTPQLASLAERFMEMTPAISKDGGLRSRLTLLSHQLPELLDELWARAGGGNDGAIDVIDFFSGCGGMSAGFRAVNGWAPAFRNLFAVDVNGAANETYEKNLGLKPHRLDVHELAQDLDQVDELLTSTGRDHTRPLVVIGCAPCQGFSSHRNAKGEADARNGLFVDFARIATHLDPDFIVIENVPELFTDRYWPHVEAAKQHFIDAGYLVHLAVHNFAQFGLPQERFRAVMLASRVPFTEQAGWLRRDGYRTVREAIAYLPAVEAGEVAASDSMHQSARHRASTIDMIRSVPKDGGKRALGTGPASLVALGARQGKPAFEDVYGRLYWDRPAITITHYSRNPASGRFVHPEQDRGLTVREAALLQGFPSGFHFSGGFDDKFSQVGNAVPPLVAAHLAMSILGQILDPPAEGPGPGVTEPLGRSFSRLIPGLKGKMDALGTDARASA